MTGAGKTRSGRQQPFVVPPSSGLWIRTRLRLTETEDRALRAIGSFLGTCYRRELADRVDYGKVDRKSQADWRAKRKRELTVLTNTAITTLERRCAIEPGKKDEHGNRGYLDAAVRHAKTRRLTVLKHRRIKAKTALHYERPSVVVGGKRLWRNRNNLDAAGLSVPQWRDRWDESRMFLTADGETGRWVATRPSASAPMGGCA